MEVDDEANALTVVADLAQPPGELRVRLAQAQFSGDVAVIDVRGHAEWESGHIPGVENIPVGSLAERIGELSRDKPVVVHCQSGARSAIAASVLQARGFENVVNLTGGFAEWQKQQRPVVRPSDAEQLAGAP